LSDDNRRGACRFRFALPTAAGAEPKGASDTTLPGIISADERRAPADDSRAPRANGNVYIASSSCTFFPTAAVRMRLLPAMPLLGLAPPPPLLMCVLLCSCEGENALVLSPVAKLLFIAGKRVKNWIGKPGTKVCSCVHF
jgi:hypothetical protein